MSDDKQPDRRAFIPPRHPALSEKREWEIVENTQKDFNEYSSPGKAPSRSKFKQKREINDSDQVVSESEWKKITLEKNKEYARAHLTILNRLVKFLKSDSHGLESEELSSTMTLVERLLIQAKAQNVSKGKFSYDRNLNSQIFSIPYKIRDSAETFSEEKPEELDVLHKNNANSKSLKKYSEFEKVLVKEFGVSASQVRDTAPIAREAIINALEIDLQSEVRPTSANVLLADDMIEIFSTLPEIAPELFNRRKDKSEKIEEYLRRVWKPWIDSGTLDRPALSRLDITAYKALGSRTLPPDLAMPSKNDQVKARKVLTASERAQLEEELRQVRREARRLERILEP